MTPNQAKPCLQNHHFDPKWSVLHLSLQAFVPAAVTTCNAAPLFESLPPACLTSLQALWGPGSGV